MTHISPARTARRFVGVRGNQLTTAPPIPSAVGGNRRREGRFFWSKPTVLSEIVASRKFSPQSPRALRWRFAELVFFQGPLVVLVADIPQL